MISFFLIGCAKTEVTPSGNASAGAPATLVAFGDSVTSMPTSFSFLVAKGLNMPIDNQASPGTVIENDEQIGRIRRAHISKNDIVLYVTGYNNLRIFGDHTGAKAFYQAYLTEALGILQASGAQIYIGTPINPMCSTPESATRNGEGCLGNSGLAYADIVRAAVTALGASNVHLVDVSAVFVADATTVYDYVHPNPAGHQQIANLFLTAIRSN